MNEWWDLWAQWLRPSAGLPTVQWSLLLALAALVGHLLQRYSGLPKIVGYSLVGTLAGWAGFAGVLWPLQGMGLFLLEFGVSLVLFDAGGRIALRWFRHNPMVLVQSLLEAALSALLVYQLLLWLGQSVPVAAALAVLAMAASPTVLTRVVHECHAGGPVTERAITLSTLSTLYALTLAAAGAAWVRRPEASALGALAAVLAVLGVSIASALVLAVLLRAALRAMSPGSESGALFLLGLVAALSALAAHLGGSAPLAALLAGMIVKHRWPRPWAWQRQLGPVLSLVTMLMFVLVSCVAAQAPWSMAVATLVLALLGARLLAKACGVGLGHIGSGTSARQALWLGAAMTPLSAVALLIASQLVLALPESGPALAAIALPAILLMELVGAVLVTWALYRAGEGIWPWGRTQRQTKGNAP